MGVHAARDGDADFRYGFFVSFSFRFTPSRKPSKIWNFAPLQDR